MSVVDEIFRALGGVKGVAEKLPAPIKTVYDWKSKQAIPPWRRQPLRSIAADNGAVLSAEAQTYLADRARGNAPSTLAE